MTFIIDDENLVNALDKLIKSNLDYDWKSVVIRVRAKDRDEASLTNEEKAA